MPFFEFQDAQGDCYTELEDVNDIHIPTIGEDEVPESCIQRDVVGNQFVADSELSIREEEERDEEVTSVSSKSTEGERPQVIKKEFTELPPEKKQKYMTLAQRLSANTDRERVVLEVQILKNEEDMKNILEAMHELQMKNEGVNINQYHEGLALDVSRNVNKSTDPLSTAYAHYEYKRISMKLAQNSGLKANECLTQYFNALSEVPSNR